MINLMEIAPQARWESARLDHDGHNGSEITSLQWNVAPLDPKAGFAGPRQAAACEDGNSYDLLHMHPRWTSRGTIKGWLPWLKLPPGAVFRAKVGFLAGATNTDGVRFQLWAHHRAGGSVVWNRMLDLTKKYNHKLNEVHVDLSHLSGRDVSLELRVDSGEGSGQDWAAWVQPRIETRSGPPARFWTLRVNSLTVLDRQETRKIEGRGDEPYLGAIFFRSVVGKRGSTKVAVLDELAVLGSNVKANQTVAVPPKAGLVVTDVGVAWDDASSLQSNVLAHGLTVMGLAIVAMEEDKRGRDEVRKELHKRSRQLYDALVAELEPSVLPLLGGAEEVVAKIEQKLIGSRDERPVIDAFKDFIKWLARADDPIGLNKLVLLGATDPVAKQVIEAKKQPVDPAQPVIPYNPGAAVDPIAGLHPRTFDLEFAGNGARYVVQVELREEERHPLA